MTAQQKAKKRVYEKLGRGICKFSGRTKGERWDGPMRMVETSGRMTIHNSNGSAWRLGGKT